jgi:serine/threonine-protein kinase
MPVPPSQVSNESTQELDAITLKAMAKNREDRYQTAREFNADLERARAGVPVTAPMAGAYAATEMMDRNWGDQTVVSSRAPSYPPDTYPPEDQFDERYFEPEDEPPRRRGWWIALAVLLLLALLAGAWYLISTLSGGPETAELPDVVDMAEVGQVVAQDPEPSGEEILLDTEITLTVNRGAPTVEVPDVTDLTLREATARLNEANLRIGERTRENSDDVDEGLVISSDPEAGDEVEEDSEVNLVISRGSATAPVPDVVGQSQADAEQRLNDACEPQPCFNADTTEEFSDVGAGLVISQDPEGGEDADKGSTVSLVISLGPEEEPEPTEPEEPEPTVVPTVVGLPANEAATALQEAGLLANPVQQADENVPVGVVIASDPPEGTEVDPLSTVVLFISNGPPTNGDGSEPPR